jgi:predicted nucleotidyltransferase
MRSAPGTLRYSCHPIKRRTWRRDGGFIIVTKRRATKSLKHPDLPNASVLERIADRLRERLHATRVIVYGSVSRGEATMHSDIDLLVVAPSNDRTFQRLVDAREAIRDLSSGIPVSPLVLTPDEVAARQAIGDQFIREILDTGIDL